MTAKRVLEDDEFRRFLKALGSRIRQLRMEKGLDMRAIMIASGYYDAQWRKYETGSSMNIASLMRVALTLKVSLGDLLDGLAQWPLMSVAEICEKNAAELDSEAEPEPPPDLSLETEDEPEAEVEPEPVRPPARRAIPKAEKAVKRTTTGRAEMITKPVVSRHQTIQVTAVPRKRKS